MKHGSVLCAGSPWGTAPAIGVRVAMGTSHLAGSTVPPGSLRGGSPTTVHMGPLWHNLLSLFVPQVSTWKRRWVWGRGSKDLCA